MVSVHYIDSGFQLDSCGIHRKKRSDSLDEKHLEYRIEFDVNSPEEIGNDAKDDQEELQTIKNNSQKIEDYFSVWIIISIVLFANY